MNLLHITTAFRRSKDDIITPWMTDLLTELAGNNNISVYTSGYGRTVRHRADNGIDVYRFSYAPSGMQKMTHDLTINDFMRRNPLFYMMLPVFIISGALQLFSICRRIKPDIITVHWPFPMALMAIPAAMFFRIPMVYVWYGAEIKLFRKSFRNMKFLLRYIESKAVSSIPISHYTEEQVNEIIKLRNSTVIPYGIRMPVQKEAVKEKFILFVGRLVERKGIKFLIEAMEFIDKDYSLRIAGTGPLYEELRQYAAGKNVIFEGKVSDERKCELYRKASLFVLPAVHDRTGDTEGLGMVLVEAMAHKTPVAATGIGGITDIVKHMETGLLCKEADPEDIGHKVNMLLRDRELYSRMQKNGFKYAEEHFSVHNVAESVRKVYEKIV